MADVETIEEIELRIKLLYAALIRAELQAHSMREESKQVITEGETK